MPLATAVAPLSAPGGAAPPFARRPVLSIAALVAVVPRGERHRRLPVR
jgi:hypothetical protein